MSKGTKILVAGSPAGAGIDPIRSRRSCFGMRFPAGAGIDPIRSRRSCFGMRFPAGAGIDPGDPYPHSQLLGFPRRRGDRPDAFALVQGGD